MKLSTKAIASLLVVSSIAAAVPGISQIGISKKRRESLFDRVLSRHDRKCEVRAEVLGMTPQEFRDLSKSKSFEQIISSAGFYSKRDFRIALVGYLRNQLRQRGWSTGRIDTYVMVRASNIVTS